MTTSNQKETTMTDQQQTDPTRPDTSGYDERANDQQRSLQASSYEERARAKDRMHSRLADSGQSNDGQDD